MASSIVDCSTSVSLIYQEFISVTVMGSWKPSMVEAAGLCGRVRRSVTNVWEDMHGLGSQAPVLVLLPFVSEASPPPSPSGRGRHTWDPASHPHHSASDFPAAGPFRDGFLFRFLPTVSGFIQMSSVFVSCPRAHLRSGTIEGSQQAQTMGGGAMGNVPSSLSTEASFWEESVLIPGRPTGLSQPQS